MTANSNIVLVLDTPAEPAKCATCPPRLALGLTPCAPYKCITCYVVTDAENYRDLCGDNCDNCNDGEDNEDNENREDTPSL